MSHLYQITQQHRELQELADSEEMPVELLADTFEALGGEFNDKAISVVHVVENMQSDVDAVDHEIKRLSARKSALSNRRDSIREYLRTNMEASGITKIECPLFAITLAKGRDVVVVEDENLIPDDLVEVSVISKPDKREILKRLKAGDDIPGARIEKSKSSLRIK